MYGVGISKLGEIIDLAVDYNIIQKSGAWFSYNDEKIGQGKEAVRAYLSANPELADSLASTIRPNMYQKPE